MNFAHKFPDFNFLYKIMNDGSKQLINPLLHIQLLIYLFKTIVTDHCHSSILSYLNSVVIGLTEFRSVPRYFMLNIIRVAKEQV